MKMKINGRIALLLAIAIASITACSSNPAKKMGPEELVVERSKAKWAAILSKDFKKSFTYLTPGFREAFDYVSYVGQIRRQPVKWTKADVLSAKCTGEICTVDVDLFFHIRSPQAAVGTIKTHGLVHEKWLKSADGQWYYAKKR